jgi:hypothetical protein
MCSPDNPDLGKADFGQRAPAFLRPVIGSCSTNRNQQSWNLIGEKAEFTRDGHSIEADHRARAEPMHFGGIQKRPSSKWSASYRFIPLHLRFIVVQTFSRSYPSSDKLGRHEARIR